jgi:hypothetical protein
MLFTDLFDDAQVDYLVKIKFVSNFMYTGDTLVYFPLNNPTIKTFEQ